MTATQAPVDPAPPPASTSPSKVKAEETSPPAPSPVSNGGGDEDARKDASPVATTTSSSAVPGPAPTPAGSGSSNPSSRAVSKEPSAGRPSFPKSKLTGEVNPFELSFSKPSPEFATLASLQDNADGKTTPGDAKPSLPSIGHITTPLAENEAFTWPLNTPAISSLRSGMEDAEADPQQTKVPNLPTPATSALVNHALAFDPSNFVRTGLTPGTGMTPLTGGPASFPPPSPNTAAFLAMVQNATASATNQMGGPSAGQTPSGNDVPMMTPGTFNNVMSQLSQMETGIDGAPPTQPPSQPDYFSHRPDGAPTHLEQQLAAGQQSQQQGHGSHPPAGPPPPMSALPPHMQHPKGPAPPSGYPHPIEGAPGAPPHPQDQHYLQQSAQVASQAANGLYLLSQAHHEIAKREQDGSVAIPPPPMGYPGPMNGYPPQMIPYHPAHMQQHPHAPQMHPGHPLAQQQQQQQARKSKRKSSSDSMPVQQAPPPKKPATAAAAKRGKKQMSEESESLNGDAGAPPADLNRPETEEEKRKNFLERNRQAALKCRQRKKAWLNELQAKVEVLTAENEGLVQTVGKLQAEVHRLQAALAGPLPAPGVGAPLPGVLVPNAVNGAGFPPPPVGAPGPPSARPASSQQLANPATAQRLPVQPMVTSHAPPPAPPPYVAPPVPPKVRV